MSEVSNTAFNEVTGDLIKSRNSKAYENNWENIFGKKEEAIQDDIPSATEFAEDDCK